MKKSLLLTLAATLVLCLSVATTAPTYAANDPTPCTCTYSDGSTASGTKVDTAILSSTCDCGHGESIFAIIRLVINIMTVGIGILGVIGITLVGIQYLTAGGSEEKTRKAKRRLFEIVVGLAAYVVVYALLNWLLPNFNVDPF